MDLEPPGPGDLPIFGAILENTAYVVRPGSYALILDPDESLAIVQTPDGLHLPGGGAEPGESLAEALDREVAEETGLVVHRRQLLGSAIQYASAEDGTGFRKECHYFRAWVSARTVARCERDHRLRWIGPKDAARSLLAPAHRWAVSRFLLHSDP